MIIPPTPEKDAAIIAAALDDPDAQPLTDEQLKAMVPLALIRGGSTGLPQSLDHSSLLTRPSNH